MLQEATRVTLAGSMLLAMSLSRGEVEATLRDDAGRDIGSIVARETVGAVRITGSLHDLPPGAHGLHVHTGGSCGAAPFEEAGPHFDPAGTRRHSGPLGDGHAGDLGNVVVDSKGKAKIDLITRRFDLGSDSTSIAGRTLVLHANPDNLTDIPENGGSGQRVACGELVRAG